MKKAGSERIYFIWSASILLCVVLALFVLFFASCSSGDEGEGASTPSSQTGTDPGENSPEQEDPGTEDTDTPASSENTSVELGETADMGQEYIDKFYFLGDSTTNGLAHYEIVDKTHVWTPTNGTLTLDHWNIVMVYDRNTATEMMITDAVSAVKPEYLLITLGVNGVSFMTEDSFSLYYEELVNAIKEASPDTKIILNSVYPVSVNYNTASGITNPKIDVANGWIKKIAENTGVKFLNSSVILKDESGNLIESYHNGDFIHPSADTYKLIIDYIRTHGYA